MRMLTDIEVQYVSGGDMETVDVIASRIRDGWQTMGRDAFEALKDAEDNKFWQLISKRIEYVIIAAAALDGLIDFRHEEINDRENKAKYDESKLKLEWVDGHPQWRVVDDEGNPTNRFWLDCDGDGRLDTQYKIVDGKLYMDVNADDQWHQMPDRADWRLGYSPLGSR